MTLAAGLKADEQAADLKIGQSIKQLRIRRGWTQEVLAARAGLTQPTIGRYEAGERGASALRNLAKVAEALGVSLESLLAQEDGRAEALREPLLPKEAARALVLHVAEAFGVTVNEGDARLVKLTSQLQQFWALADAPEVERDFTLFFHQMRAAKF
ncbi:helix-turn-helix domain-containing protein [Sphingomonas arenae]|uniref:helix-turn-helix domain-containing protein n=1 Tax=Sphingomonas arenae TaxID=2812555 RepID=UPI0019689C6A|nr:helix-turn-helix transcriptional regulator [Sphingomonas arenae]